MAFTVNLNQAPATGTLGVWSLFVAMIAAGWTKVADSDGTTYSAAGTQVTHGGAGAGGLGNTSAWVKMRAPAVTGANGLPQVREEVWQRGTTDLTWRRKYSSRAGFSIGVPTATLVPAAADEVVKAGGGTDAAPTYLGWLSANGGYRLHVACGGAAEKYSWVIWTAINGTGVCTSGAFMDVLEDNTYPNSVTDPGLEDVDPCVTYHSNNNGFMLVTTDVFSGATSIANVTNPARMRAWLGATSAAGILTVGTNSQNVGLVVNGLIGGAVSLGTNPFSGKGSRLGATYQRSGTTAPVGMKGVSRLFQLNSVAQVEMSTLDLATTEPCVIVGTGKVAMRCWPQNVNPIV